MRFFKFFGLKGVCTFKITWFFSILIFQYKGKKLNITNMFGVSGDNPDEDDDNAHVNVALNDHQKSHCIVRRKSTNIGGIR